MDRRDVEELEATVEDALRSQVTLRWPDLDEKVLHFAAKAAVAAIEAALAQSRK